MSKERRSIKEFNERIKKRKTIKEVKQRIKEVKEEITESEDEVDKRCLGIVKNSWEDLLELKETMEG